ncbi:MAG TPA: flagellar basal-body rod protein FlgG [Rhodospirillaceae bacterium]|nr:MAG: flagellar basal-body rod protein FlgG [Alphaproteobacteria bacterium GWF2_58_20]HAU29082.1 flagellar basal-body rod protein FlgG [Rhodospirillaceae bacterium]
MRALSIGATGMLAQQTNVEVISNNIANMATTAYKRQRAEFQDLMYQNLIRPGTQSSDAGTITPSGIQLGSGSKLAAVYRIDEQGEVQITDNDLDLAINGHGYFQVEMPDGTTAYTRAGSFQLNADGEIVTNNGYRMLPNIVIPPETISMTINTSGEVMVKLDGQITSTNVGRIETATFANNAGLEAIGSNLFLETPASGTATTGNPASTGFGSIQQGALETSNVNIVSEITNLIAAQRAYEMNSKVIQASDDMMASLNQMR